MLFLACGLPLLLPMPVHLEGHKLLTSLPRRLEYNSTAPKAGGESDG